MILSFFAQNVAKFNNSAYICSGVSGPSRIMDKAHAWARMQQ